MNRRQFLSSTPLVGAAVLASTGASGADNGMVLLREGRSAQVWTAPGHEGTAGYFIRVFYELTGQKLEVVDKFAASDRPLVVIGDKSDETVRRIAGTRVSRLTPQGILLLTSSDVGRPVLLVAAGSASAVPWAVGELLNFRLDAGAGRA